MFMDECLYLSMITLISGTTERVCLIIGSFDGVITVHNYVMDRIMEKPDPNPNTTGEGRLNVERHKQVKILVPNSTAGMVIGKGGSYIQEIKEKTGAYVQISQKSREFNLLERCIVVAGELDQTRAAVHLILGVIAADPQSASCPNLSYHDIQGPVASVYPTGSPYAIPIIPYLPNPTALSSPPVDVNSAAAAAAAAAATMMAAAAAAYTPGPSQSTTPSFIPSQGGGTAFGFFPPNFPATPDVATLAALSSDPAATGSILLPSMLPNTVNGRASCGNLSGDLFSQTGSSPWLHISGQTGFDVMVPDLNAATPLAVSVAQQALAGSFVSPKPQDSQSSRSAVSPPVFFSPSSFIPAPLRMSPTALFGGGYPAIGYGGSPPQHTHLTTTRGIPPLGEASPLPICSAPTTLHSLLTSPALAANVALAALSAAAAASATTTTSATVTTNCTKHLPPVLPNPGAAAAIFGLLPCSPLSSFGVGPLLPHVISNDPITMSIPSTSILLSLTEGSNTSSHGLQPQQQQQHVSLTRGITSSSSTPPQVATALPSSSTLLGLHGLQYSSASNMITPVGNYVTYRRVISVPENVINIIVGHQGRSIMDLQLFTGTGIQISQKTTYLSGTQQRTVTITGPQVNVQSAADVIEHIIAIEHMKRESGSCQQLPGGDGCSSNNTCTVGRKQLESDYFMQTGISYPPISSSSATVGSSVKGNFPEVIQSSTSSILNPMMSSLPLTACITSTTNSSGNNNNNSNIITGLSFSSSSSCDATVSRRSGGGGVVGSSGDLMLVQSSMDAVPMHAARRDQTS
ncbi:RNA-binding protein [Schistosoma japonicum]|uniref:RNA-binding protein n=1 Tax=Schistosoma japonicum TaxID=6182 RepID=A0A4Z2CY99_SCHJA|nr:RNA-binding protein Nova-1 [Schistosoma japonicum]KAH8869163.1 RNA-binding protein Nova-1 [Schistosoma japonicum]TNN09217.1 RNA-binding protein [Schistosoma japonicum]